MNYPIKCKKCNNLIYGPVQYCPFCGAVFVSVTAPAEKQDLDVLRSEINSSLPQGEYTPDFRQFINKKGKSMGIGEESSDIILLEVLKEKKFIPDRVNTHDSLSECWHPVEEKEKNIDEPKQKPETVKEEPPKEEKREEVEPLISKTPEPPEIPVPPSLPPKGDKSGVGTAGPEDLPPPPPPPPLFWKVVAAIIVLSIGYFVYTNFIKSQFLGNIDRALAEKRYLSPSGNSVADFYRAKKAKDPNSPELKDAVSRIRQKLEPIGDTAFQQLYSDSIDTDWDNTVNIYNLLNEIMPDDRDILAKAEFCRAHQIIKSRGKKNYGDALVRYQKALDLKPNWILAMNGIAKVYIRKDSHYFNKEEALNRYSKVSEADPNFPWAYTNIAAIYMEDKQWDMAEQALLSALRLKNNSPSIFTELGKACEKQQKARDALNYYQEAMKYEKDSEKIAWLQKKISAIQQQLTSP